MQYGTVKGRFLSPDGAPLAGVVRFAPEVTAVLVSGVDPATVLPSEVAVALDGQGRVTASLLVPQEGVTNPVAWTWRVTTSLQQGRTYLPKQSWSIDVTPAGLDLTTAAPVPSVTGEGIVRGASAYETWKSQPGNENGTEADFLASLGGGGSTDLTGYATTTYVDNAVANVASSAPGTYPALGLWAAQLTMRQTRPFPVVCVGDSNTEGYNMTNQADTYPGKLAALLQSAYPSGQGTETTVQKMSTTTPTVHTTPGVHVYNGGISGLQSHDYISTKVRDNVRLIQPGAILHAVGANDFSTDLAPATFKTNMLNAIAALDAEVTAPHLHVLVHTHERSDAPVNPAAYTWADYGAKLKEIADADPSKVVFVDLSDEFKAAGFPGTDPLDIGMADLVHLTPAGNALLAQLLYRGLNGQLATTGAASTPAPASDTTAPTAVTNLTAGAATENSVPLSWTAATDDTGVTGYEYSLNGTTWTSTGSTGTTYTVTGLTAGTSYTISVRAFDAAGNRGTSASVTATTATSADTTAPTAPTNLAGTPTDTSMALSWTASTDNVGVTAYRVSSDNGATWVTSTVTGTSYTVTGLASSTSYTFAVAARDAAGNWSTNAALTASTNAAAPTVATYAADTFTRADSTTLGSTETGGLAWTVKNPASWSIVSNTLRWAASGTPTDPNDVLVDTGQSDGTVSITKTVNPHGSGLIFRVDASNNGYLFWTDGAKYSLTRRAGSSGYATLASSTGVSPAHGDVVSVVLNGSSITCKVNGSSVISVTDATYTGTKHGAWTLTGTVATTFDDFKHTAATA